MAVRPPDAMVLDLILPDGSGVDVLRGRSHAGAACRSSSCRRWATSARRYARWTPAPTTTSPSRSGPTSSWPACARCFAASETRTGEPRIEIGRPGSSTSRRARSSRDGEVVHLTPIEFDLLRVLATAPREAGHAPPAPARGLGPGVRERDPLPAGPRRAHPGEDRAGSVAAAVPRHRARSRLPAARRLMRIGVDRVATLRARPAIR